MSDEASPDEHWLHAALARYERPLLAYANGIVANRSLAEDLVQETFIRLSRETRFRQASVAPWLFTVCKRLAIDALRRHRHVASFREESETGDEGLAPAASASLEDAEFREILRHFVDALPDEQREVVRLRFFSELSYREIGEITRQSTGSVGWLLHTALCDLREQFRRTLEMI